MRLKLTILGLEIFEWILGKEEDLSALLPAILGQLGEEDEDKLQRFGGNDYCSFEIDPEAINMFDEDEEWEEDDKGRFGFHA